MAVNSPGGLFSRRVCCKVLEIEPVQVREPAVLALDHDRPAADRKIVGTEETAVPARGFRGKRPDRPAAGFLKSAFFVNLFHQGYEDPGRPAGRAGNVGPVRAGNDMLVCILPAVVAVGAVIRDDKPVVHEGRVNPWQH
jgi:hypothetical protein